MALLQNQGSHLRERVDQSNRKEDVDAATYHTLGPGPAQPLGKLGDRLGRQPLRDAQNANATEKEKGIEKLKNQLSCTPRS